MPTASFDAIDKRILTTLQTEGRLSNVDLADRVALSPSPCLRRLKRLEQSGVIRGWQAVLDRRAVGLALTVFVEITVEKHNRDTADQLQQALLAIPELVACHMVSGEADFLAEIVVPDLDAYERLLTERLLVLPMIESIRSNFSLRLLKTDGPLPLDHL